MTTLQHLELVASHLHVSAPPMAGLTNGAAGRGRQKAATLGDLANCGNFYGDLAVASPALMAMG